MPPGQLSTAISIGNWNNLVTVRLMLWHKIDHRFAAWGPARAGTFSFDVLGRLLGGNPIGRIVGADAMKFEGWQRLVAGYAKLFEASSPVRLPRSDSRPEVKS